MATLQPPTDFVREVTTVWNPKPGKWHTLRQNRFGVAQCGKVFFETLERSTVDQIKAKDICLLCWPYGKK